MTTFVHTLKPVELPDEARILQPPRVRVDKVTAESPALAVMTDLRKVRVITISPETPLNAALMVMINAKVRLLIAIDEVGVIVGLVSAQDLMGEKPLRVANDDRIHHDAVLVRQVMTRCSDVWPLNIRDVEYASVSDIVMHLIASHKQHALVIEPAVEDSSYHACGIFSATQIGRQLGEDINVSDGLAQSFSELERLIA
ncbi:MAG: CBS domain-containing protein [Proteobacteria bacterium]|nr:MAG: CBS domain-containing protein [Pseudomonadota bacterium]